MQKEKIMHRISNIEEKLMTQLDVDQKKLLQEFVSAQGNPNLISGEERFIDGFRMGVKFILEIFEKDDGQLKLITG